jgi:hypothetical protein
MTDKVEKSSVEIVEEVEKTKDEKVVEKPVIIENGDVKEKVEAKEKSSENGKDKVAEENGSEESEEKPAVKRKSTAASDATDGDAKDEAATPEKKAKLDEKETTEAKVDAEVEA